MPALLGALFCAAGLLAIPGKAFSQGQGMNRPIGIMYLRPLVGSLSAIVAAILLYGSNHADAQAPAGIGIMYLTNNDGVGDPIHDWSTDPALTNLLVQGIALRTQWGRVEPHEHANADDFYWDFLDQGVALAAAHGKKVSILVTACLLLKLHEFATRRPASRARESPGDAMHECALVHLKEDLSLGPVQSAFRYAEESYMSVFESQKLLKKSRIS